MYYRRKPVAREVVDAILDHDTQEYVVLSDNMLWRIPKADFERDYEPLKRKPSEKKKGRTRKPRQNGVGVPLNENAPPTQQ